MDWRATTRRWWDGLPGLLLVTVGFSLAAIVALVLLIGAPPLEALGAIIDSSFGGRDLYNLQATLTRATLIAGMALVATVAFRAGCINLGGEGQMLAGGLASAVVALHLPGPGWLVMVASLLAAAGAGALYAMAATSLRWCAGVPLLLSTFLLNYPARYLTSWLVNYPLKDVASGLPQTHRLPRDVWLPSLGGSDLHLGLPLVLALALGVALLLRRSVPGFEARMMGHAPRFAMLVGINVRRTQLQVMAASGGLAGITGAIAVVGDVHRYIDGMLVIPIYAWTGIFSALMAGLTVAGSLLAALFFSALQSAAGGLERAVQLPREVALVLQALVIMLVASRVPSALDDRRAS